MDVAQDIADLNRRFGIPGLASVVEGNSGLPKVSITSPVAAGEMYLHGAQVTSWKPAGAEDVLFLSARSLWKDGHAIRGGIPICFPWFRAKADDPQAPAHGFVRTKAWNLESIMRREGAISVSMFTENDASTKQWWPADFRLVHRATFGPELRLELELTNTGTTAALFQEALHAYHRVGDIRTARLHGLDKVHYLDNTDSNREKVQDGDVVITSQTDRAYLTAQPDVDLEDPTLRRKFKSRKRIRAPRSCGIPGRKGRGRLSDLGDDEWTQMFCVEASNVLGCAVELTPGQKHRMAATIRVELCLMS